jgi:hypothetical protein
MICEMDLKLLCLSSRDQMYNYTTFVHKVPRLNSGKRYSKRASFTGPFSELYGQRLYVWSCKAYPNDFVPNYLAIPPILQILE